MTFKEYSSNNRGKIELRLKLYFASKKNKEISPIFTEQNIIEVLEEFSLSGKLIRGTLFLFACEMLGMELSDELVDIACAIELMHTTLLIHDDIIDNDLKRRGGKTVFAQYIDRGNEIKAKDPRHYGVSIGIIVGDISLFFAMELIARYSDETLSKLMQYYSKEIYLVALAQSVDSELGQVDREASEEDIYAVYKYKTARYTFSLSFIMAGIIAQTAEKNMKLMDEIGELAGIIFQLKDDEIGLMGNEEVIGKPVGSDIRENKKTIVRLLLFKEANIEDRKFLEKTFGNSEISENDIEQVRNLVRKYSIDKKLNDQTEEIMNKIWEKYADLSVDEKYKVVLKDLLEYNLKRTY